MLKLRAAIAGPMLAVSACAGIAAGEDSVAVLRSGVRVTITEISAAGALASGKASGTRRLSLAGVRSVEGPLAGDFREQESLAIQLWRAGARLDRGDAPGAEPLYEAMWAQTAGVRGPTRAEVAAGLLACRVQRGAFAAAIESWAAWLAESPSLESTDAERCRNRLSAAEGLDSSAQWLIGSPPVFVDGPFVRAFAAGELVGNETGGMPDVLSIYRYAAKRDTATKRSDPFVFEHAKGWNNIAGDMVLAESGDPQVRERARKRLQDRAGADALVWQVQWARLGLGRSLRLEPDAKNKTDAVIELLWIASRESVAPNVLAQALAAAAETLLEIEDRSAAARVLADLEARLPEHPIIGSARLSRLRAALGIQTGQTNNGNSGTRPQGDTEKDGSK